MADLQGRALDAAVAERVMGWRKMRMGADINGRNDGDLLVSALTTESQEQAIRSQLPTMGRIPEYSLVPRYSSNYNAICEVRAEIERRGLQNHFCSILDDMTNDDPGMLIDAWAFLNATPEQQCRAALKAVEGAHA